MNDSYRWVMTVLWVLFLGYWLLASRGTASTELTESAASRLSYSGLMAIGAALLAVDRLALGPFGWQVLPEGTATFLVGLVMLVAGLAFAVWARVHLGRYWSGTVTLKVGHELIRSGPYSLVRHPIYTGITFGILGTAVALGELHGFIGAALVAVALGIKLRREEAWLTRRFGDTYRAYQREVKALVPHVW